MAQTSTQQHSTANGRETSSISESRPGNQQQIPTIKSEANRQQSARATNKSTTEIPHSSSPLTVKDTSQGSAPTAPIFPLSRQQPAKGFVQKCNAELETLLQLIKDTYHDEIKSIANQELYADLIVQIGEDFKKPLHKCIFASRAFKLFSALKAFELVEVPVEEDIIISEFQGKDLEETSEEGTNEPPEIVEDLIKPEVKSDKAEEVKESLSVLHCGLPDDLIKPDLFLNFIRRVYLDQDLTEEENKLNQRLIDWLKLHKPELVRQPKRHSPCHQESFRTIQPFFEELSMAGNEPKMAHGHNSVNTSEIAESPNVEELDEASQATSIKDESLTSSLLTRTETFELISRNNNPDSSSPSATPSKNILTELSTADISSDTSNSTAPNTPTPFAPTTRTGLKPKTFTTPTGLHNNSTRSPSTGVAPVKQPIQAAARIKARDDSSKTSNTKPIGAAKTSNAAKQPGGESPKIAPIATKRSSITSKQSIVASPDAGLKTKVASPDGNAKVKIPTIARAQPISLERSQSPATNAMKGARNFIAANKRLVAQMEKKVSSPGEQGGVELETETVSAVVEPLTSDNLVTQMDKFTLISYSKLADAFARMFIDEIFTDTILLVKDEKQVQAHKCILAARSAYLAELITKQSTHPPMPSSDSSSPAPPNLAIHEKLKIDLTEFSHPAVYFSIMHIYSGIVKVPDDIDLDELTKLTHLLHVTTLRQVCMNNLRMIYCHFFHKPCNVCCLGVLKTLPLAWRYDYTELYTKCLQWIGSHFANIFGLKEFSELKPHDLVEECYSATLNQLTPDNIILKTIECQKLLKSLPRVKWTEQSICLIGRLLEDFCHYVADNYEKILQTETFSNLSKNYWECEVLEENLLAAMNHLKPDSGCKTLIQLHKIECSLESFNDESQNISDSFANLISKMRKYCERYLLKEAAAVVHCSSWRHMNPSLQKRIKDQAIISTDFDEPNKKLAPRPPRVQSVGVNNSANEVVRSPRSTPDAKLKAPTTKPAAARHIKVLK